MRPATSVAHSERPGRHAAGDRLADRQEVGLEPVRRGVAARAGAERVGLVDQQQGPGRPGQVAQGVVEAGLGQDDSDVGEGGLGQDARDLLLAEDPLERLGVVELDRSRGLGRIDRADRRCRPSTPAVRPGRRR